MAANPLQSLMRFCAYRERAEHEVHQKAVQLGLLPAEIKSALATLKEEGFLNQDRFLRAYVHDKRSFQGWGPYKIQAHLRQYQIPNHDIQQALEDVAPEAWIDILRRLVKQKNSLPTENWDAEQRQKMFRWLYGRGFTSDQIRMVFAHEEEAGEWE
jgi:regulatory protein